MSCKEKVLLTFAWDSIVQTWWRNFTRFGSGKETCCKCKSYKKPIKMEMEQN